MAREGGLDQKMQRRDFLKKAGIALVGAGIAGTGAGSILLGNEIRKNRSKVSPSASTSAQTNNVVVVQENPAPLETAAPIDKVPEILSNRTEFNFLFDGNVSASDGEVIKRAAFMVRDFYHDRFGVYANYIGKDKGRPLTIFVSNPDNQGYSGFSSGDILSLQINKTKGNPEALNKSIFHEYFHFLQYTYIEEGRQVNGQQEEPPEWLTEGFAEYTAYKALGELGILDFGKRRSEIISQFINGNKRLPPIADTTSNIGTLPVYQMYFAAVDRLIGEGGIEKVMALYKLIGQGNSFNNAFGETFDGQTQKHYEIDFEQYRTTLG